MNMSHYIHHFYYGNRPSPRCVDGRWGWAGMGRCVRGACACSAPVWGKVGACWGPPAAGGWCSSGRPCSRRRRRRRQPRARGASAQAQQTSSPFTRCRTLTPTPNPRLDPPRPAPCPTVCRRYKALNNLHPLGLTEDWSDKLRDQAYMSDARGATFEHYIQVGGGRRFVCEGVEVGGCAWVPKKGRGSLPCLPEPA